MLFSDEFQYEVVSVLIAVTLLPAGQTPKQQIDHYKHEIVAQSQELESQGNVVRAFCPRYIEYMVVFQYIFRIFMSRDIIALAAQVVCSPKHFVIVQ